MKSFEYLRPRSIAELVKVLSKNGGNTRLLAGGTDLLVLMKQQKVNPEFIISLKGISNLAYIREQRDKGVSIGTMTLLRDMERSDFLQARYPMVTKAAGWIGSPQVRYRATCGGNLCNGAPSADLAPPLICLGSSVVLAGKGKRTIPLEKFFLGPGKVDLKHGEFLKEVVIPPLPPNTFGTYLKFTRSAMDIAVVGVAVLASFTTRRECTNLRICLGAVAPIPLRAVKAEEIGVGRVWDGTVIDSMARMASEESKPIDDVRGTIFLRKRLVEILTRRGLVNCLEQTRKENL